MDTAVAQAAEAALAEPDNPRLAVELVKLPVLQQRFTQADVLMKSLPAEIREKTGNPQSGGSCESYSHRAGITTT
ncbi:MAG: hypothetical protein ACYC9J_15395 [Sulfuricaulis sp.]